ncbi:MAG: hypothetical protein O9284_09920 [Steroidobacteraceae bacterium]|nr:hypothetical protein [Steroidobacteraceae bacterium]
MLFAALMVTSTTAHGGRESYHCSVSELYELQSDGKMGKSPWNSRREPIKFSVDRLDGRIIGGNLFANSTAQSVRVLNRGDSEWGFKVVTVWSELREFQTLIVNEFVSGPKKPFKFSDSWGRVYAGTCE